VPLLGSGGDEFYALREYRAGDDLRQVHWVSTARTDELMIRQPQNLWRGRTTVLIDARASVHDGDTFEALLSAGASLAVAAIRGGMQVRTIVAGSEDAGFGSGAAHEGIVLDMLAVTAASPAASLPVALRGTDMDGPLVLLTTDSASPSDVAAATRAAGRSDSVLIIFTRGAGGSPSGDVLAARAVAGGRCRVVRVGKGESFAQAWARGAVRPSPVSKAQTSGADRW